MAAKWNPVYRLGLGLAIGAALLPAIVLLLAWLYTAGTLKFAQRQGVYPSPEKAMIGHITHNYRDVEKIEIVRAEPSANNEHVWYVIAHVWAGSRPGGGAVGMGGRDYDVPGSYFVQTREGWVYVGEITSPEQLGFWMEVFGLAGK